MQIVDGICGTTRASDVRHLGSYFACSDPHGLLTPCCWAPALVRDLGGLSIAECNRKREGHGASVSRLRRGVELDHNVVLRVKSELIRQLLDTTNRMTPGTVQER